MGKFFDLPQTLANLMTFKDENVWLPESEPKIAKKKWSNFAKVIGTNLQGILEKVAKRY